MHYFASLHVVHVCSFQLMLRVVPDAVSLQSSSCRWKPDNPVRVYLYPRGFWNSIGSMLQSLPDGTPLTLLILRKWIGSPLSTTESYPLYLSRKSPTGICYLRLVRSPNFGEDIPTQCCSKVAFCHFFTHRYEQHLRQYHSLHTF